MSDLITESPPLADETSSWVWKNWHKKMWEERKANLSVSPAISSSQTLDGNYFVYPCNATGGAFTVTLPPASENYGKMFALCKNPGTLNVVTLTPYAGDAVFPLSAVVPGGNMVVIISDGLNTWYRLSVS